MPGRMTNLPVCFVLRFVFWVNGGKILQEGSNPLFGWKPSVPEGQRLELGTEQYDALEQRGMEQVGAE